MPRSQVDQQDQSFFDPTNGITSRSLLQAQFDPSTPNIPQLQSASGLLIPDYRIRRRLDHFPEDLYDLRAESHLSRFLSALLGDSGAGSVRKRYLIARLQSAWQSTHFFDLDRFYGAIFGAQRFTTEQLRLNPYTDTATQMEWEDVQSRDTRYRERIFALAKAIPMGGTPVGLRAAAEAITGVECEIYESWKGIDYSLAHGYRLPGAPRTWGEVQNDFQTYDDADGVIWDEVSYEGGSAAAASQATFPGDRAEFVIRVKKNYSTTPESLQERAEDEYAVRQVLNRLKPANMLLVIDTSGIAQHEPLALAGCYSDSNYYEVLARVTPHVSANVNLSPVYPVSSAQAREGIIPSDEHVIPRPIFTQPQGTSWSYNNEVVSIRGAVLDEAGAIEATTNIELVTNYGGQVTAYGPEKGLLDPRQVEAARLAGDGALVSHPYAADRRLVQSHV